MIVHEWSAGTGDAAAEGVRFGAAWAPQLITARDAYIELFEQSGVPTGSVADVADGCRDATESHAPHIAAEFEGMAQGSGLSLRDVYLLTARTEILARMTASMECSTIVHVPESGGAPRTLQTWDWHVALSNETLVRRLHSPAGTGVVTFCEFGQPAKIGVNDRGLGVHFNILHHVSDGSQAGVPVHVLARMILEDAVTVADAVAIAERVPLGASSVLTVAAAANGTGTPAAAAAIEVSPAGIAVIAIGPGETLAHTNHFLDAQLAAGEYSPYETTSRPRFDCLVDAAHLAQIEGDRDRALAFGAIPAAPISVRPRMDQPPHVRWETKLTVAIDVAQGALEFAAAAPADVGAAEWHRIAIG